LLKENDSIKSHPIISYGWAKLVGEKQIEYLSSKFDNTIILRFVGIYGNNQDVDISNGSLIPVLSYKSLNFPRHGFKLLTDGSEIRSYCHIDDAIDAIKKIIISTQRKKYKGEVFNICSNENYSIHNIAKKISKLSEKNIKVKKSNLKADIKCQICDNSKLKKFIKWQPKITIDEGLKAVYEDLKNSYFKKNNQN
jgi:UDP-glucose 4-epimerase